MMMRLIMNIKLLMMVMRKNKENKKERKNKEKSKMFMMRGSKQIKDMSMHLG